MESLEGVMALTYTPLNKDFTLNESAVRDEIDWVIDQGATGIWPGGFAGQWPEMDETTRKRHLDHSVVGYMKKKFSLMSGIEMGPPLPPYQSSSRTETEKAKKAVAVLNEALRN